MNANGRMALTFLLVLMSSFCYAGMLNVPAQSDVGALFVIEVTPPEGTNTPLRITYEKSIVQYLGPVVFSTEIQSPAEGIVEIAKAASGTAKFLLKFLPLPNASATTFVISCQGQSETLKTAFVIPESEKSYHWSFLIVGLILLFVARYLWNYQKKSPALMSTRSLFMNFDELKKVRENMFPGTTAPDPTPAAPETPTPAPSTPPATATTTTKSPPTQPTPSLPSIPDEPPKTSGQGHPSVQVPPQDPSEAPPQAPTASAEGRTLSPEKVVVAPPANLNHTVSRSTPLPGKAVDPAPPASKNETVKVRVTPPAGPAVVDSSEAKTIARPSLPTTSADTIFVRLSDNAGAFYEGSAAEITLGRRKGNTILFSGSEVSRNQAVIKRRGQEFVIEALTTSNVTEVNGKVMKEPTPIKTGDTISFGGTPYRIMEIR